LKSLVHVVHLLLAGDSMKPVSSEHVPNEWPATVWLTLKLVKYKESLLKNTPNSDDEFVINATNSLHTTLTYVFTKDILTVDKIVYDGPKYTNIIKEELKSLIDQHFTEVFRSTHANSLISKLQLGLLIAGIYASSDNPTHLEMGQWKRFWAHFSAELVTLKPSSAAVDLIVWISPFLRALDPITCISIGSSLLDYIDRIRDAKSIMTLVFGCAKVFINAIATRRDQSVQITSSSITHFACAIGCPYLLRHSRFIYYLNNRRVFGIIHSDFAE